MSVKFSTSNLSSTSQHLYNLDTFNGVDYTTTPTKVDSTRAIDMSNYLPDGKALVKRYGTRRIKDLTFTQNKTEQLLDIFDYNGSVIYIYADSNYIYINNNLATITTLTNNSTNATALHFEYDGRLFVIVGGNYIMIYKNNNQYVVENVLNNAYIPTVITNLNPDTLDNKPLLFEQVNMLSNKVKIEINMYISSGKLIGGFYDLSDYFDLSGTYTINGIYYNNKSLTDEENIYIVPFYNASLNNVSSQNATADEIITAQVTLTTGNKTVGSTQLNGIWVTLDDDITDTESVFYTTIGIELTLNSQKYNDPSAILNATVGIAFGSYGNKDRLFLGGAPSTPNVDFHSLEANSSNYEWADYTYFGTDTYQALGSSSSKIVAYGLNSDGTMAIFKDGSDVTNIFTRRATITTYTETYTSYNATTKENTSLEYQVSEELFPTYATTMAANNNSVDLTDVKTLTYDNKLIFNTKKGIYYVNINYDGSTSSYNAYELSYYIREDLSEDISDADMIIYKDKLFVARKDKTGAKRIYVADKNRYSYIDSKLQYEWWVLDGINADKFFILENNNDLRLYFSQGNFLYLYCDIEEQFYDYDKRGFKSVLINGQSISSEIYFVSQLDKAIISPNCDVFKKILEQRNLTDAYYNFIKYTTFNVISDNPLDESITVDIKSFTFSNKTVDSENHVVFKIPVSTDKEKLWLEEKFTNGGTIHFYADSTNYSPTILSVDYEVIGNKEYFVIETEDVEAVSNVLRIIVYIYGDTSLKVKTLYTLVDNQYICIEDCIYSDNKWWYKDENENLIDIGNINFNYVEFDFGLNNIDVDFYGSIVEAYVEYNIPVKSYWYSNYNSLGRIDCLKTATNIYFVPEVRRGGITKIGYKTLKHNKSYVSIMIDFDFNNINFELFSFGKDDFGKTFSSKKKIKNFSFMQLFMYSDTSNDSTISEIAFKYLITKNNKGEK